MALNLLITHADELFRKHLSERLGAENCKVFQASQGVEATDIIQQNNIDVTLLGAVGSRENRLSLLKTIKGISPRTEVILLTEAEEHSIRGAIEAMQSGAFDDLLLPVDVQTLLMRIREAFKMKKERLKNTSA
jgi:DNA-binding NtrC family response regulator